MIAAIELSKVTRRFPAAADSPAGGVEDVDLIVYEGERLAIVGPSGAGKSTIIRLIAGLERPDSGLIRLRQRDAARLAPSQRGIALTLQGQAPYPHLSVVDNLAFSLRARKVPSTERLERVRLVAESFRLPMRPGQRPGTLSGGERQRVVLGRAIAAEAPLTLLDEPFAALDAPLRVQIRRDLIRVHDHGAGTWIIVTHDQEEALALGHRVVVLIRGKVAQVATPVSLLDGPATTDVAAFLGASLIHARVALREEAVAIEELVPGASWQLPGSLPVVAALRERGPGPIVMAWRPERLRAPDPGPAQRGDATVTLAFEYREWTGSGDLAVGSLGSQTIRFRLDRACHLDPGDRVTLRLPLGSALWFDPLKGGSRVLNA